MFGARVTRGKGKNDTKEKKGSALILLAKPLLRSIQATCKRARREKPWEGGPARKDATSLSTWGGSTSLTFFGLHSADRISREWRGRRIVVPSLLLQEGGLSHLNLGGRNQKTLLSKLRPGNTLILQGGSSSSIRRGILLEGGSGPARECRTSTHSLLQS